MSDSVEQPETSEQSEASLNQDLANQLAEEQKKSAEYWDLLLRNKAEFENFKRRAERDLEAAHKYSTERLLQSLLPILDSLEQAIAACEADSPHRAGVEMTLKLFEEVLSRFGVLPLSPAVGDVFDPMCHEAMMMQKAPGEPNRVINVIQKGYRLHERVVRPARVIVSQPEEEGMTHVDLEA